jgi:hypothetical protein
MGESRDQQVTGKHAMLQQRLIMVPGNVRFVVSKELANANIAQSDHAWADGHVMRRFQFCAKWSIG